MTIGVLALVGVTPERVAALTAAGYAVREGKHYANRTDAVREAADTVRAVLTNGRGGLSGDEMALLPKLEIVCAVGAGYEAVDLDTARRRGIVVANCPDANAPAVADSAMMLLMAATRHLLQADRFVRAGGWQDQWRVETPTMTGKRLGILGLGNIGQQDCAARRARLRHGDRLSQPGGGRRIPLSLFRQSHRARDVGRFPGRRRAGGRGDAAPRQRGRARSARTARLSRQRRARDGRGYPGPDRQRCDRSALRGLAWMSSRGNRASRHSCRSCCNATTWWSRRMSPGARRSRVPRRPR